MLVKCICTNCAGHLEFEEENAGRKIACPHCRFETVLSLPEDKVQTPPATHPRYWGPATKWVILGVVLVLAGVSGILYVLYHWGVPWLQDTFTSIESSVTAMVILVAGCIALPFLLLWLVLPVILTLQLRQVVKALAQIAAGSNATGTQTEHSEKTAKSPGPEEQNQVKELARS